jgi:hypothetical protein
MTPTEAFETLRRRRIDEIVDGRSVYELALAELLEILRLDGVPIPRFENPDAEASWIRGDDASALLNRVALGRDAKC